jgi:hypothetical protein
MKKSLLALILCGFLAACASPPMTLDPVAIKLSPITVPTVDPIQTAPVTWQVIKGSDMLTIAKAHPNVVIFGLDQSSFKNLNVNLSEATRYMQQEKAVNTMLTDIITERQAAQNAPVAPPVGQK